MPKFRQIYNKFTAEGDKVCREFMTHDKYHISEIYVLQGHEHNYDTLPSVRKAGYDIISIREMEQISQLKTPSPVFLLLDRPDESGPPPEISHGRSLYLDGIQDPGNTGTIIRIADWFGVDRVIRSEDTADFYSPKVVQASMGSMVNVDLMTCRIEDLNMAGLPVYGTFMDGTAVTKISFCDSGVVILGSEGKGISARAADKVTDRVAVPGAEHRVADSLNVAVAAGIIVAAWNTHTKP